MPFFTAIGSLIAGTATIFGGAVSVAGLIGGALSFGASVALNYLLRPKKRSYSAVQGEVQFGGDVPVGVQFGKGLNRGQRLYYAVHGKGDKYNSEVYALSNGWCDGLEPEIYFYGKKHTLKLVGGKKVEENFTDYQSYFPIDVTDPEDIIEAWTNWGNWINLLDKQGLENAANGMLAHIMSLLPGPYDAFGEAAEVWQVEGFDGKITIRFYDGNPTQNADSALVANTAHLANNWKSTSRLRGICYVVVEAEWDSDYFEQGWPDFGFVLRGVKEYDPRKDSTVAGGSGSQRINNQSTWRWTQNPAVHRLNYQLGIRGLISNRLMIGEGKSLGQLDLGSYFASMNVCDTPREGKPTYQCSLYVQSEDDHTEVLKELDDAMAGYGMNRRGLSGVIAGAPQTPVYALGPEDIDIGRPLTIRRRRSAFEMFNHLSGQFTSPKSHWQPESLKPIYVNQHVTDDGRPRQAGNDFLQVIDPDIAQYLLQIRYRQNRKGGSATVPVSIRAGMQIMEGDWITFDGLTWLVTNWHLSEDFKVTLTLAETGSDVYSSAGIVPGPIVVEPPTIANPSLISTVQDFAVEVGTIMGADNEEVPALRFTWTPPNDPTIVTVRFEYFIGTDPTGQRIYRDQTIDVEAGEYITSKDVRSGVQYTARATITTRPDRLKTWTPWVTTTFLTPVARVSDLSIKFAKVAQDVKDALTRIAGRLDILRVAADQLALDGAISAGANAERIEHVSQSSDAIASAHLELYNEVHDGATGLAALSSLIAASQIAISNVENGVEALSTSLLELQNTVAAQGDDIEAVSSALLAAQNAISDLESGGEALSTALLNLESTVASHGDQLETQASLLTGVDVKVDDLRASGLLSIRAQIPPPSGVLSEIDLIARATELGADVFAGLNIQVYSQSGLKSRVLLHANQTVVADSDGKLSAIFEGDTAYFNKARIGQLSADNIAAGAITTPKLAADSVTASKVAANAITTGNIVLDSVSRPFELNTAFGARSLSAGAQTSFLTSNLSVPYSFGSLSFGGTMKLRLQSNGTPSFAVQYYTYLNSELINQSIPLTYEAGGITDFTVPCPDTFVYKPSSTGTQRFRMEVVVARQGGSGSAFVSIPSAFLLALLHQR